MLGFDQLVNNTATTKVLPAKLPREFVEYIKLRKFVIDVS